MCVKRCRGCPAPSCGGLPPPPSIPSLHPPRGPFALPRPFSSCLSLCERVALSASLSLCLFSASSVSFSVSLSLSLFLGLVSFTLSRAPTSFACLPRLPTCLPASHSIEGSLDFSSAVERARAGPAGGGEGCQRLPAASLRRGGWTPSHSSFCLSSLKPSKKARSSWQPPVVDTPAPVKGMVRPRALLCAPVPSPKSPPPSREAARHPAPSRPAASLPPLRTPWPPPLSVVIAGSCGCWRRSARESFPPRCRDGPAGRCS